MLARESRHATVRDLMYRLAELLPERMRGVYGNNSSLEV
jgi:hypothetical protein